MTVIRIGTRKSTLAMWQANEVRKLLELNGFQTEIIGIHSGGDMSLGGDLASSVGQFIHSVDSELLTGNIDIAVHSSKDVPVEINNHITNLAYLKRGCTTDLLISSNNSNNQTLEELFTNEEETDLSDILSNIPKSGMVGTTSGRRQSFILSKRPDIIPIAVRGHVETRLKRLQQGRIDAIILAEVGLRRLHEIKALQPWVLKLNALRINERQWPTAPGQGSISVHCKTENYEKFKKLREILNHPQSENDVLTERDILRSIGGGCLYPAGIKITENNVSIRISPKNWRDIFCQGLKFKSMEYNGNLNNLKINLPEQPTKINLENNTGPKIISTLNSERLSTILKNNGINIVNKPVLDLIPIPENWPKNFLDDTVSRSEWPYLILTSPFAAKCAIEIAKQNNDLNRIQWLAIGEGTARACFMRGVTVSICAKARNSSELTDFINRKIDRKIHLMIPRSNIASSDLIDNLVKLGFNIDSWIGYKNKSKQVDPIDVMKNDVLLLSSPSSARAWIENSLPIPKNILCMGKASQEEIESLQDFADSEVEILQGPTADFITSWWKKRGE